VLKADEPEAAKSSPQSAVKDSTAQPTPAEGEGAETLNEKPASPVETLAKTPVPPSSPKPVRIKNNDTTRKQKMDL
jgi:hypothetical protein